MGHPFDINVDSRVDNECPPSQSGDVAWPLRHMANEGTPNTTITNKEAMVVDLMAAANLMAAGTDNG